MFFDILDTQSPEALSLPSQGENSDAMRSLLKMELLWLKSGNLHILQPIPLSHRLSFQSLCGPEKKQDSYLP